MPILQPTRSAASVLLAALCVMLCAGSAQGAARRSAVSVEDGFVSTLNWTSCAPQTVSGPTDAPPSAESFPAPGPTAPESGVSVTRVDAAVGVTQWLLAPNSAWCVANPAAGTPLVSLAGETFRRRWTTRRYLLRASPSGGVTSIAGWRVDRRSAAGAPTVARARARFGTPTSLRRGGHADCTATWRQISLRITFVNYHGLAACSRGLAQSASITDPTRWAVVIAHRPGIIETSQPAYLRARGRASPTTALGAWSVARVYIRYGTPGYYPSVSVLGPLDGRLTGIDAWIGAGGDGS